MSGYKVHIQLFFCELLLVRVLIELIKNEVFYNSRFSKMVGPVSEIIRDVAHNFWFSELYEIVALSNALKCNISQVKDARQETIGSDEIPVISWQQCSVFGSRYRLPLIPCRFLCQIWIFGYDRRFHCVSRLSFRLSTKLSESES